MRSERQYGKYVRRFNLGQDVNQADVKASFDNGVLTLNIPKQEMPEEQNTKIAIN